MEEILLLHEISRKSCLIQEIYNSFWEFMFTHMHVSGHALNGLNFPLKLVILNLQIIIIQTLLSNGGTPLTVTCYLYCMRKLIINANQFEIIWTNLRFLITWSSRWLKCTFPLILFINVFNYLWINNIIWVRFQLSCSFL